MSADLVANVILDSDIVDTVDCGQASKRVMNCITTSIGRGSLTQHVEMDAVASPDFGLPTVSELRVSDLTLSSICTTPHND